MSSAIVGACLMVALVVGIEIGRRTSPRAGRRAKTMYLQVREGVLEQVAWKDQKDNPGGTVLIITREEKFPPGDPACCRVTMAVGTKPGRTAAYFDAAYFYDARFPRKMPNQEGLVQGGS